MAWTFTEDLATIGATEYFLMSDSTTKTDQTSNVIVQLFLDLNALASGDEFRIRFYERVQSAGTARIVAEWIVVGVQAEPHYVTPSFVVGNGWEFSVQKLSGTDRSIPWSIRQIPEA